MVDKGTAFIKKALDILFVSNPKGTSLGVLIGNIMNGLINLFSPYLKENFKFLDFTQINVFFYMSFGVFLTNSPYLFKRPRFNEGIEGAFSYISEAKREGKLSEIQIRQMYINLYNKVLENIGDNSNNQEEKVEKKETSK